MTLRKIIPSGGMGDGRRRRLFGVVNGVSLAFVVVNIFYFLQLVTSDVVVEDIIESMKVTAGVSVPFKKRFKMKRVLSNKNWHEGKSLLWLNWATKLDETDVYYFLPDMYDTLKKANGEIAPDYVEVKAAGGRVSFYIVGTYKGDQPFGPFWDDELNVKLETMMKNPQLSTIRRLKFAKTMHNHMRTSERERIAWEQSFLSSYVYFMLHRRMVKATGECLGVEMRDHDLTKSRIVQIATGRWFHWRGDVPLTPQEIAEDLGKEKLVEGEGMDATFEGHLEKENHHPQHCEKFVSLVEELRKTEGTEEFKKIVQKGKKFVKKRQSKLDPKRLMVDRTAVHLQKDAKDQDGGWYLHENFIPSLWIKPVSNLWETKMKELRKDRSLDLYKEVYERALTNNALLDKFLTPIAEFLWENGYEPLTGEDISKGHLLRGFDKGALLRAFNNHNLKLLKSKAESHPSDVESGVGGNVHLFSLEKSKRQLLFNGSNSFECVYKDANGNRHIRVVGGVCIYSSVKSSDGEIQEEAQRRERSRSSRGSPATKKQKFKNFLRS